MLGLKLLAALVSLTLDSVNVTPRAGLQLHTPNRRYTFTGDLRGIVDRMPTLQQTHYGSQYPNEP